LGTATKEGKVKRDRDGVQKVAELLTGFLSRQAEALGTPKELALRMARLAHMIRNLIISAFETETEGGSLHGQLAAFRDNLIPDLSIEYFADMYAQTIAYGLFAARCTAPDKKDFTRFDAAQNLPKTNPFLRKLFQYIAGYELDDRIAWLVDDLAQVLAQADMEAVLKDFGKHMGKEDPVMHFYETFLKAYDPKVREMRGVYYTPEPVVSYIVRSVDHILKTCFGRPQGLADDKTLILDPAVGTATFLYAVINEIRNANISQGQQGRWNNYVAEKLLPRIFGFELLMAPYAVAHLKLGLLLQETGYEFQSDQRLGIYLTNTLEEAFKKSEILAGFNKYIVDEANAAAEIKKDKPIMVVLGNPPYSNFGMMNKGKWISDLLIDYKKGLNEKKLNLEDDFIKFIRFGQWRIDQTGSGILAFITNNTYIDGITRRRMRQSLLETFSDIYILDLHGSITKKGKCPHDSQDDNVFDIQQGVAIGIFVKEFNKQGLGRLHHAELWGTREKKYEQLSETDVSVTKWTELKPKSEYFFFVPKDFANQEEYEQFFSLRKAMKIGTSAVQTKRDALFIDFDRASLHMRMKDVLSLDAAEWTLNKYPLQESPGWSPKCLKDVQFSEDKILEYLHRPFDKRFIYYDDTLLGRSRITVFQHLLKPNLALATLRQTVDDEFRHVFCCRGLCDINLTIGHDVSDQVFPLYLYPTEGEMQFEDAFRHPNLSSQFIKAVSEKLGLAFVEDGKGDLKKTFGPEDIFNYAYAVFHSPTYRSRYGEFLKTDFPRLPLTSDKELFKVLVAKGAELVALHLMESPVLDNLITKYPVTGSDVVEKVAYDEANGRVYINKRQCFEGVPSEVWKFQIGGYQVCHKWLKDRKDRTLTYDELTHYQKVVVALKETIRLMQEIDELIPSWPLT
jgi:predicted helicase